MHATSNTVNSVPCTTLSTGYKSNNPSFRPHLGHVTTDSDYCVKLFATQSMKPVDNKRFIVRINAMPELVKKDNEPSISLTHARTNADNSRLYIPPSSKVPPSELHPVRIRAPLPNRFPTTTATTRGGHTFSICYRLLSTF